MDMMLTGRALSAKNARAIGLVDKVVEAADLVDAAAALAAKGAARPFKQRFLARATNWWPVRQALAPMLVKQVAGKAPKAHYPAPYALIETWRRTGGGIQSRLAAERMIMSVPKRGFFARTPSEDDIFGLYSVNRTILDAAVARWPETNPAPAAATEEAAAVSVQERSAEQLARQTGELFLQVALRSGVGEFAEIVRNMNDRLHHARVLECEIVPDVFVEITRIAELIAAHERLQLRQALVAYHDERSKVVAAISKELLLRPFTTADW